MQQLRPLVVVTGAAGNIGKAIAAGLGETYRVVGLDINTAEGIEIVKADLTSADSIAQSLAEVRGRHGGVIASLIHLAAYFDFTGEEHPLYAKLNVEGTRILLQALDGFTVEQFVYAGTMLVHAPTEPDGRIDEDTPLQPKWAYPKSKAAAEQVVREEHGATPIVLLRLAGLYDEEAVGPTLAHQIDRIFRASVQANLYSGDIDAGQAAVHVDDMVDLFRRVVDRRAELPAETVILAGEEDAMSYGDLQQSLGQLLHGEEAWRTLEIPVPVAQAGAWLQEATEPLVPDAFDQGKKPFIRPFMVEMASDHYALDISRARRLLQWEPRHSLRSTLPEIVRRLKADPAEWYHRNGVTPPDWVTTADEEGANPYVVQRTYAARVKAEHFANIWALWFTIAVGSWLITAPATLGYDEPAMIWSDVLSGIAIAGLALVALSPRFWPARWAIAAIGLWLTMAPLVFWTTSAAAYLNGTLSGALAIGFSVLVRPPPGGGMIAAESGPTIPPGWSFSPSNWLQRLPIVMLAFVGLYFSRYLAAYQLGHIDAAWDPFFAGSAGDPRNGTEEIVTSSVSQAFPVPDAGLGAVVYLLEILTGVAGSARRWRTMPWLVVLFGFLIVPLGAVSIGFIIIQPIYLGTWCTLCLIGAAAMLLQIPYSLDELVATGQFLARRRRQGRPLLRILFAGDTDEGPDKEEPAAFDRPPLEVARGAIGGAVSLPWNLAAAIAIGLSLMFTRLTVGADGAIADADHLIGALVVTVSVTSLANVARALRFLNIPLGLALIAAVILVGIEPASIVYSVLAGVAVVLLSLRRGRIEGSYGSWDRWIF